MNQSQQMRRILLVSVLILISVFSVSAFSLRAGIGAVSSAGISFESGRWDFDLDIRSVHPVVSLIGPQILPDLIDEDADEAHWKQFCGGLFNGMGTSASFRFVDSERNSLAVGLDLVAGMLKDGKDNLDFLPKYEKAIFSFLAIQLRYTFRFNENNGLFISAGYPFFGWFHVCSVPNDNDGYGFSSVLWIPQTLIELEEARDMDGFAKLATLGIVAATLRIGYVYTF